MKRFQILGLLAAAALCSAPGAQASPLTPAEALARVTDGRQKSPAKAPLSATPVYTASCSEGAAWYAFDTRGGGFMILSADSDLVPMLGYTDEGSFSLDACSPATQWWLDQYTAEIDHYLTHRPETIVRASGGSASSRLPGAAIAPMVTTKWNQDAPYNDLCPKVDGKSTYTGCVATAMAQIVNYWKHPAQGTGSYSYQWQPSEEAAPVELSFDYGATTIAWGDMLDSYVDDGQPVGTEAQKKAVATLMSACGVGVNMNYGVEASGAFNFNVPRPLINNFGFNPYMQCVERNSFITGITPSYLPAFDTWDDLVYSELQQSRPVYYSGVTRNNEGHAFVCDGYDGQGNFHINWGWGGMADGYFRLSALDPAVQGIGGAASGNGFAFAQCIILGLCPEPEMPSVGPYVKYAGDFSLECYEDGWVVYFSELQGYLYYQGCRDVEVQPSLLISGEGGLIKHEADEIYSLGAVTPAGNISAYRYYTLPVLNLPKGSYRVTPAVKYNTVTHPMYGSSGYNNYVDITVDDAGKVTVTGTGQLYLPDARYPGDDDIKLPELSVTSIYHEEPMWSDRETKIHIVLQNTGEGDYANRKIILFVSNGTTGGSAGIGPLTQQAGTASDWTVTFPNGLGVDPGLYNFYVSDDSYKVISDITELLVGQPVTSIEHSYDHLTLTVDAEPLQLEVNVLPEDAAVKQLEWHSTDPQVASVSSIGLLYVGKEGSAGISASTIDHSGVNTSFMVSVSKTSAIDGLDADNPGEVYDLSGHSLGAASLLSLPKGTYIIRQGDKTVKIIK